MPSLDDLKKAGANLVDSAKSGKLVEDIKARIETVGERMTRDGAAMPASETPIKEQFKVVQATLKEIYQSQSAHTELLKKLETQLGVLSKVVDANTVDKPLQSSVSPKPEEKK
jgi:cell division FtsZ-interacting protein ZapD